MKNFVKMEKVFKCFKRKCFITQEEVSYYLKVSYKLGSFFMIQNEREVEVFIAFII